MYIREIKDELSVLISVFSNNLFSLKIFCRYGVSSMVVAV